MCDPECPQCGYQDGRRIAPPSRVMAQLEGIDLDRAGTYACLHCGEHYMFEAQLPVFSTTAQCPDCQSFDTRVVGRQHNGNRYHMCVGCKGSFKTRDAARLSADG